MAAQPLTPERSRHLVFRSLFAILDRRGIVHVDHNETYLDEVLGWTLAAVGFYFQYTQMFSPPFVVELLLLAAPDH